MSVSDYGGQSLVCPELAINIVSNSKYTMVIFILLEKC